MITFVIATHNKNKLIEFQRILRPFNITLITAELAEVEETGKTFEQNAFLKAQAACRQTGMPAVADDSGLMVDALNGKPGVYSARYAGEGASDFDRINKLLKKLEKVPKEKRTAKFVCSICCVFPNGKKIVSEGECRGEIAYEPKGNSGFGYDPVFLINGKSFAQLSMEEKDLISHRGCALRKFEDELRQIKENNP